MAKVEIANGVETVTRVLYKTVGLINGRSTWVFYWQIIEIDTGMKKQLNQRRNEVQEHHSPWKDITHCVWSHIRIKTWTKSENEYIRQDIEQQEVASYRRAPVKGLQFVVRKDNEKSR